MILCCASSVAMAQWTHGMETDATTGMPSCVVRHASHAPGWPIVGMLPGITFAWPDGERAMGTTVSIRVDDRPERTGTEWITGNAAQDLVSDLEHGRRAETHHVSADTNQPVEATADLQGIAEQIDKCRAIIKAAAT